MRSKNIGVQLHNIPVHFHPYYKQLGFKEGYFSQPEEFYSEIISIPIYPSLSTTLKQTVIDILEEQLG